MLLTQLNAIANCKAMQSPAIINTLHQCLNATQFALIQFWCNSFIKRYIDNENVSHWKCITLKMYHILNVSHPQCVYLYVYFLQFLFTSFHWFIANSVDSFIHFDPFSCVMLCWSTIGLNTIDSHNNNKLNLLKRWNGVWLIEGQLNFSNIVITNDRIQTVMLNKVDSIHWIEILIEKRSVGTLCVMLCSFVCNSMQ